MWNAEKDDELAFERRLDAVVREIGDRGKLIVPEAVTPFREPTPAPAPAPATAPKQQKLIHTCDLEGSKSFLKVLQKVSRSLLKVFKKNF